MKAESIRKNTEQAAKVRFALQTLRLILELIKTRDLDTISNKIKGAILREYFRVIKSVAHNRNPWILANFLEA